MPVRPAALALLTNFLIPDCTALHRPKNVIPAARMVHLWKDIHRTFVRAKPTRCDFRVCGV